MSIYLSLNGRSSGFSIRWGARWCQAQHRHTKGIPKGLTWVVRPHGQYISNKRPSHFVILSAAKDLAPDRDPSLRSEPALERSEGMTLLHRLRLTRNTSYLKCIEHKPCHYYATLRMRGFVHSSDRACPCHVYLSLSGQL